MENPIKTIQEKVNGMKGRLRDRLDSLPPRVRLKVVLVMFGLFARVSSSLFLKTSWKHPC